MNRRSFLQSLIAGGTLLTTGCVESLPFTANQPETSDVFESYRFDGTDLVVKFQDTADVQSAVLYNSSTDQDYETIKQPPGTIRFPVVFPDRLETYISKSLRIKAKTTGGWTRQWIPEIVHAYTEDVKVLRDGRARFEIENQGVAPLLVRFVGIYGDVPNPTVDPQTESFDQSSLNFGPGVIGIGQNRPLSPSRTDLVVSSGETAPFETTYAPFAFPNGADVEDCDSEERTAEIATVHASGGSASYTFSFGLHGEPAVIEGQAAEVCDGTDAEGMETSS